jgi:hypothetical protein
MVQHTLPVHPLMMKNSKRRHRVARQIKSLVQDDLEAFGNWNDVEVLGQGARLESVDLDEEEIFETRRGVFECLATLYVSLIWPEELEFLETFAATIRGKLNGQVAIDEIKIDTTSFTGEGQE